MSPRNPSATVEALLEHANWLRRLARSLVGDGQKAEDLSQETWLRALEHPPETDRPLRGWLATVMRNVLRQEKRSTSRRMDREHRVADGREEAVDEDALALLGKVTMQRELVAAVLELEEPYRQTILLRYFEEYTPKKIAAEKGIPVATVKTRLQRGLQRLRAHLDGTHGGDGRTWALALLPLARRPAGLGPAFPWTDFSLGALAVNTKLVVAALGLGVVGATLFVMSGGEDPLRSEEVAGAPMRPAARPEPRAEVSASTPAVEPSATEAQRSAVLTPGAEPAAVADATPDAESLVRGRVIDVTGRAVGGVDVRRGGDSLAAVREGIPSGSIVLTSTSADGSFEIEAEGNPALVVQDERYTTVLSGTPVRKATGKETIVVVARRIELAGQVSDSSGLPVEGALVRLVPPADLRARLGVVLDFSMEIEFRQVTDSAGYFDLSAVPAMADAVLTVRREGYLPLEEPGPLVANTDLLLTLESPAPTSEILSGIVVDESGFPVEGALVSMGIDSRTTDARGLFRFELDDPQSFNGLLSEFVEVDAGRLLALKRGYLPAELIAERDAEGRPVWRGMVELRLGSTPLSITGSVVDAEGNALSGRRVWIADPTFFGGQGDPTSDRFPSLVHVENELAGGERGWHFVETDERGRFAIDGVLDREYTLAAMDPTTLLRIERTNVRGGKQDVRLVLPGDAVYATLRGRVVDRRGAGVPNVQVAPMCDSFRTRMMGQVVRTRHTMAAGVNTDAEGRFELKDVPRDLVYLRLDGVDTVPLEWGRNQEGGLYSMVGESYDDLEIEVGRRCHFQVELARTDEADQVGVLDSEGNELEISEFLGSGRRESGRFSLTDGRTNLLGVSDAAVTLVLYREGEEVRRAPLHLVPGEQTVVRP